MIKAYHFITGISLRGGFKITFSKEIFSGQLQFLITLVF